MARRKTVIRSTRSTGGLSHLKSISFNILRVAFILIICGIFMPVGCKSNGMEVAQGILGNADFGRAPMFLAGVEDIYGYILLAVFLLALVGLIVSFINRNFLLGWSFSLASLALLVVVLIKFNIYFDFSKFSFYIKVAMVRKKLDFEMGTYAMMAGYFLAAVSFILRAVRRIN